MDIYKKTKKQKEKNHLPCWYFLLPESLPPSDSNDAKNKTNTNKYYSDIMCDISDYDDLNIF